MRKLSKREWALLALVPAVVFVAAGADNANKDNAAAIADVTQPRKNKSEASRAADPGELDLAQLRRTASTDEPANLFAGKSWYVPPPPPAPPKFAPPPPPVAPPLPFTYLGRYQDSATSVIFLVRGDRVLMVNAGDVIEGTYRVDGIVGSTLVLTYLPLDIKQSLDVGSAG